MSIEFSKHVVQFRKQVYLISLVKNVKSFFIKTAIFLMFCSFTTGKKRIRTVSSKLHEDQYYLTNVVWLRLQIAMEKVDHLCYSKHSGYSG